MLDEPLCEYWVMNIKYGSIYNISFLNNELKFILQTRRNRINSPRAKNIQLNGRAARRSLEQITSNLSSSNGRAKTIASGTSVKNLHSS